MARIGIIFGGRSGEHEVSLMSAASVIEAMTGKKFEIVKIGITKNGEWRLYEGPVEEIESGGWEEKASPLNPGSLREVIDFAFPVLHGPFGEDGTIQGLFEILGIPYAGCGVLASSVAMDKLTAKEVFTNKGLPVCSYMAIMSDELFGDKARLTTKIEREFSAKYPLFVKPSNMGSSVGVSKVGSRIDLALALLEAAKHDSRLIVEEGIDARELEIAVLGNKELVTGTVGEIVTEAEFYDYNSKYIDENKTRIIVPANVSPDLADQLKEIALDAFRAIDCAGFARVDFLVEKGTERIYLSEINTIPGFTRFSMFPRLWNGAGFSYSELLERIVDLGYERHNAKNRRQATLI